MIGVLAGLVAVAYAIEAIQDFANPAVPPRLTILGEFIMCSMPSFRRTDASFRCRLMKICF